MIGKQSKRFNRVRKFATKNDRNLSWNTILFILNVLLYPISNILDIILFSVFYNAHL